MTFRPLKISDEYLSEINEMFDWHAAAPLPDGRLLGRLTPGKRPNPNPIPDTRIKKLNDMLPLAEKTVLEIGCFEGIHTVGLRSFTKALTAIDIRPSNVAKTQMRLSLHGTSADVFVADAETLDDTFGTFDLIFHFGVLYHLLRPVEHLTRLATVTSTIYLDTHYCEDADATDEVVIEGTTYKYHGVDEGGWKNPFSGKDPKAIHLTLDGIETALKKSGLTEIKIIHKREERNGPRILLLAQRPESD